MGNGYPPQFQGKDAQARVLDASFTVECIVWHSLNNICRHSSEHGSEECIFELNGYFTSLWINPSFYGNTSTP